MTKPLRPARILLTNDDGIDAPGLAVLVEIAREFAQEIWIVAPQHDESGTGQSLSLHHPLRCHPRGERRWAVNGTPADCVALATGHLMKDAPPSIILSGINAGNNTGGSVNLSGTLGGAFMGLMLGIPSIALSQDCASRKAVRWDTAHTIAPKMIRHFLESGWPENTCLSINIPDRPAQNISGFCWSRQDNLTTSRVTVDRREDMRGEQYFWMTLQDLQRAKNNDFDHNVLERGDVAVTALSLDRSVDVALPRVAFDTADAAE